jgi:hypothetical protein
MGQCILPQTPVSWPKNPDAWIRLSKKLKKIELHLNNMNGEDGRKNKRRFLSGTSLDLAFLFPWPL